MTGDLKDCAEVRPGHPFRSRVLEDPEGKVLAVQMRDVSLARGVAWDNAIRTTPKGRKEPDWLRPGDILFIARGGRNFAVCVEEVPMPAVCAQYFFLLRAADPAALLPRFLAWQINQPPAQNYLRRNAEGTDQLSIRRGILEALPVTVPPLEKQQKIITLENIFRKEKQTLERLIRNSEQQMKTLAFQLLDNNPPTMTDSI